jgi:hypothetical protein
MDFKSLRYDGKFFSYQYLMLQNLFENSIERTL